MTVPHDTATAAGSTGSAAHRAPSDRPEVTDQSVGQILGRVTNDLSTLMRQEVALAKAEITAEAKTAAKGAGMLGAAGFAGYMVVLFLSLALMWGLSDVMNTGWAALIVAAVWAIAAGVLAALGRTRLQQVEPKPEQTIETVKEIPAAVRGH